MRVAIVGSRGWTDADRIEAFLCGLAPEHVVISGGAGGADSMAAGLARGLGLEVVEHLPDWSVGRHAGFLRNQTIVDDCDVLVAFWDGRSKGTKDSIDKADKAGKLLAVWIG